MAVNHPPCQGKAHTELKVLIEQEEILLSLSALWKRQVRSIHQAMRAFDVPRSTLRDRLHGRTTRPETRANGLKLSDTEEESVVDYVISTG
jgi:hypothetical protein